MSNLTDQLKAALDNVQCECNVAERISGHRTGCWRPEQEAIDQALCECVEFVDQYTEHGCDCGNCFVCDGLAIIKRLHAALEGRG